MFCAGCGAPLALRPEPPAHAVDTPVPLDRRAERVRGGGGPAAALPAAEAGLDRVLDELAAAAPRRVEPEGWGGLAPAASAAGAGKAESSWSGLVAPPAALPDLADTGAWRGPGRPSAPPGDVLPEVEVDALEIHLRRPAGWRRAAAWLVDAAPFALCLGWGWKALCDAVPGRVGEVHAAWRYLELAVADRGALLLPLAAAIAVLGLVYAALSHALAGATLGKRLLGLRVVGADGRRPSLRRSAARAVLSLLSAALLGLGLLLALFTRSGRALHDLVARTWVVEAP